MKLRTMIKASAFSALICIATIVFVFPLTGSGYANIGDCLVLLAGFTLGPVYGACAAGIGAMLADLFIGFAIYMPATLVIKGGMAALAGVIAGRAAKTGIVRTISATVAAECVMVGGYFAYECLLYGASVAVVNLAGNGIQAGASVVIASILWSVACRTRAAKLLRK